MLKTKLRNLGRQITAKRGKRGVRGVAQEIGISAATLSRVERGYLPDLETFRKICAWMEVDPGSVLGVNPPKRPGPPRFALHFRKDRELEPEVAQALAKAILAAQRAWMVSDDE